MPKQLIVLCDGTTNSPEADIGKETNVQMLRKLLGFGKLGQMGVYRDPRNGWEIDQYSSDTTASLIYYDRGLGAPRLDSSGNLLGWSWLPLSFFKNSRYIYSKFTEKNEQITAHGIIDNVAQAYSFLVNNYEPGDKIFLFGFSRGAYTLRILEKVIRYIGIINKHNYANNESLKMAIEQGFSLYDMQIHPDIKPGLFEFRKKSYSHENIIHFLGLWDTVRGLVKEQVHSDAKISSAVKISRHALAIDEQRKIFKPEVWIANPNADSQQIWFVGAHCDIGGGYIERGLANITLHWMATEAIQQGLEIDPTILQTARLIPDPLAMQTDSLNAKVQKYLDLTWKDIGGIYRRPVAQMTGSEQLHESVLARYGKKVKRNDVEIRYQPSNLTHTLVAYQSIIKNYNAPSTEVISMLEIPDPDTLSDVGNETSLIFNSGM